MTYMLKITWLADNQMDYNTSLVEAEDTESDEEIEKRFFKYHKHCLEIIDMETLD